MITRTSQKRPGGGLLSGGLLPGPAASQDDHADRPPSVGAGDEAMADLVADLTHRLFAAGVSLESARGLVGAGPAADRIAAATDELDQIVRHIMTMIFSQADRGRLGQAGVI